MRHFFKLFIPFLVTVMLVVGFTITYIFPDNFLYYAHKATGVMVLALVLFTMLCKYLFAPRRLKSPFASLISFIFNIMLIAMPLSGIAMILFKGGSIDVFGFFKLNSFMKNQEIANLARFTHKVVGIAFASLIAIKFASIIGTRSRSNFKK